MIATVLVHDYHVVVITAYGWGTFIISVASQLGVITILFSYNNQMAKYLISLLIAVGISTLVTDAILHLIPKVMVSLIALCDAKPAMIFLV